MMKKATSSSAVPSGSSGPVSGRKEKGKKKRKDKTSSNVSSDFLWLAAIGTTIAARGEVASPCTVCH